jgi:hypothetical protein
LIVKSNGDLSKQFGAPVEVGKLVAAEIVALVELVWPEEAVPLVVDMLIEVADIVPVSVDVLLIAEVKPDRPTMLYTAAAAAPPQF